MSMPAASSPERFPARLSRDAFAALLHVGRAIPPSGFAQFWSKWRLAVSTAEPELRPIDDEPGLDRERALGVTHILRSHDGVRVGARLMLPSGPVRGVVVMAHGYTVGDGQPLPIVNPWHERGAALLAIRLRGYPGSSLDVPLWCRAPGGWIAQGIEDAARWSMTGAVGDLVGACAAVRRAYGARTPIGLHGESLGAAVALIAASQISGKLEIDRLVAALPTMGDWVWRLRRSDGAGLERDVRDALRACDEETARQIRANLRLMDTVVHARRVVCPVLMKIAAEDPIVPPATVAAVFNALGSAPGTKWRFLVQHGHTPGTPIADLRRHALFEKLATDFLDPSWSLDQMRTWEPSMLG
jgi:cephalosporin-C deacetylase-like acetyl esterase